MTVDVNRFLKPFLFLLILLLSACGGGGGGGSQGAGGDDPDVVTPTPDKDTSYRVGGTVTGLQGSGLVLQNNQEKLGISANGDFVFANTLRDNESYHVSVASQPVNPEQRCTVSNGSGTVSGGDITSIRVDCVDVLPALPPDPGSIAPALKTTGQSDLYTATAFIYSGDNPVQSGVAAGTIEQQRVAVIRGRVLDRDGQPVPAVSITIKGHAQYGSTLSRADGMFDMAVNGGMRYIVEYRHRDYLSVHREVETRRQDYTRVDDVVLVARDPNVTTIDLSAGTAIQVARGSSVSDADGARQATLMFPRGTTASMVMPDGSSQPLTTLNVRLTEYTVGDNGALAMPAALPATSGYTYAVELSVDEAEAAGASRVDFSAPVSFYVENFLGFPVGGIAPVGLYNRRLGKWEASDNGVVVEILAVNNGLAELDIDGSGTSADAPALAALGVTEDELRQLASLYAPGTSLWRVPIPHFTPCDINWPWGIPRDIINYVRDFLKEAKTAYDACMALSEGSIIECENQVLGQRVAVTGTPYSLNYRSSRVPGRKVAYSLDIPVTRDTVPAALDHIKLEVHVAGQVFKYRLEPTPSQVFRFTWDGKDAYGRQLQGMQRVRIRIGNASRGVYMLPADRNRSFNAISGIPFEVVRNRSTDSGMITTWKDYNTTIGTWDARQAMLGGWTLSSHHYLDIAGRTLFFGDGSQRSYDDANRNVIKRLYPDSSFDPQNTVSTPGRMDLMPDGRVLVADARANRVHAIDAAGNISVIAGTGAQVSSSNPDNGDGGPATSARVRPLDVVADNNGGYYVLDADLGGIKPKKIRYVSPQGMISTVAIVSSRAMAIALNPQGEIFFLTGGIGDAAVYRIDRDGNAIRYAGKGPVVNLPLVDDVPATKTIFYYPADIVFDRYGNLYISDSFHNRIRRVGTDGIITSIAGTSNPPYQSGIGDGGPATSALVARPSLMYMAADGSLYFYQYPGRGLKKIRKIDSNGIITTVAGSGFGGAAEGLAVKTPMLNVYGLSLNQQGELLFTASEISGPRPKRNKFWRVASPFQAGIADTFIASADASVLYHFDADGKHLETLNALTGAVLLSFEYDAAGRLLSITDAFGDITQIERSGDTATAIISPDGHRTELVTGSDGYLSAITNPAGETYSMQYTTGGLLTAYNRPNGTIKTYAYNAATGQLIEAPNLLGGTQLFSDSSIDGNLDVRRDTALNRTTRYQVAYRPDGTSVKTVTMPDGAQTVSEDSSSGSSVTQSDGVVVSVTYGADPRYGGQAIYPETVKLETGGITASAGLRRVVTLTDATDLTTLETHTDILTVNAREYRQVYTAATATTVATTPAGRRTMVLTSDTGQILRYSEAGHDDINLAYDARGRLQNISQGGRLFSFSYDDKGYLGSLSDSLGREMRFVYDAAGRPVRQILPDGQITGLSYDAVGNLVSLTPPGKPRHAFSYNDEDLLSKYSPPAVSNGGDTLYSYNDDKQLTGIVRPGGISIDFLYDDAGHLQQQNIPRGSYQYAYGQNGRIIEIRDPDAGVLQYSYQGGLLTQVRKTGFMAGTTEFSYDSDLRLQSMTVNGMNAVGYTYDADGLLLSAGDLSLDYNTGNTLLRSTSIGDVTDIYTYNSFGEVIGYAASTSTSTLMDVSYERDAYGRITRKTETIGNAGSNIYDFSYDINGRLQDVRKNSTTIVSYSYDANGNRLSEVRGAVVINASYDAQDRLLTYGDSEYSYTPNGELQSVTVGGSSTQYQYDANANLLGVSLPGGGTVEYLYDGRDRRIARKVNGALVQGFLYQDQLNPVAELDAAGNVISRFVYGNKPNIPEYIIKDGKSYRVITDHRGSPRLVVDVATGNPVQQIDYDEFGNVINDTNPGFQPFGYAGGLYDADTGLLRFGARDYDPKTGRWLSKDTSLFSGGGTNLYEYASNDPVNLFDITGYSPSLLTKADSLLAPLVGFSESILRFSQNNKVQCIDKWVDRYVNPTLKVANTVVDVISLRATLKIGVKGIIKLSSLEVSELHKGILIPSKVINLFMQSLDTTLKTVDLIAPGDRLDRSMAFTGGAVDIMNKASDIEDRYKSVRRAYRKVRNLIR